MPGCIVSAITASFRSVEKRRRLATPVITSTFENVSDIGVCPGLYLGPPAKAGVRLKRGAVQGTLFSVDETGLIANTKALEALRALIAERHPDVLIADPLAELHTADENNNSALRMVIAEFRAIAVEFNIAVILVHHTRKGAVTPGDPDTARGASAIIGAARIVITVVAMSEEDAEAFGLDQDRKTRSQYIRIDDAKQNYAAIGEAKWYEKIVYPLDNSEMVPAAVPWKAPNMWRSIPPAIANAILDEIDAGLDGGKYLYSVAKQAKTRHAFNVVKRHLPALNETQCRKTISTWDKNGVFLHEDYDDTAEGKARQGVRVNPARRPGAR